jgi:hypothetical protein
VQRVEGGSLIKAPFDKNSGSVAPNYTIRSQKHKTETFKKANMSAHPLPEPVEGGSLNKAPFDKNSGSVASNYDNRSQKPRRKTFKKANMFAHPLPEQRSVSKAVLLTSVLNFLKTKPFELLYII